MDNQEEYIVVGRNPVLELFKSKKNIEKIYVSSGDKEGSILKIISLAKSEGVVIEEVNKKKLDALSNNAVHQGVCAITNSIEYVSVSDIINDARNKNEKVLIVVCDDIEDPHNLGAIIRCADGAGASGVIVGKRHSSPITPVVIKSSAGATAFMKIAKVSNIAQTIDFLKENNVWVYGADGSGDKFTKMDFNCDCALVLGNEGHGISKLVKDKCDAMVSIPMRGGASSLNVSTAAAVLLYDISEKQGK